MIVSIHQPQYLPWPGYWDKMARSDVFVILDNVQFKKNEWQNRNRIKCPGGWQWLTVPVRQRFGQRIQEVVIDNRRDWRRKHRNALRISYARSPYFNEYEKRLCDPLLLEWDKLIELNLHYIRTIKEMLGIKTQIMLASGLGKIPQEPTARLTAICKRIGATRYISGSGGRDYLEVRKFALEDIEVVFQQYTPPIYPQRFGDFVRGLSVVDVIFNCGKRSLEVIKNGSFMPLGQAGIADRNGGQR